jgi:hypothetical protein
MGASVAAGGHDTASVKLVVGLRAFERLHVHIERISAR